MKGIVSIENLLLLYIQIILYTENIALAKTYVSNKLTYLTMYLSIAVHCWDYRKFIVQKAGISNEEELEFSNTKIMNNISNYSSWHYRSRILYKMFGTESEEIPIIDEKYREGRSFMNFFSCIVLHYIYMFCEITNDIDNRARPSYKCDIY